MPRFRIKHPDGRSLLVEGATPPSDDDIDELFSQQDGFPGMPSPSMRNKAQPWQMPQVGNVDQLAQFQKEQEPPEPPPMLARPKEAIGLEERNRGLDDPQSDEFLALRDRAQMQGTADAAGPSMGILAAGAGGGLLGLNRLFGAGAGATSGYKKSGLKGAIGGGIAGAILPTTVSGLTGLEEGYELGGIKGAAIGGLLGVSNKLRMASRLVKALRDGKNIEDALKAAITTAKVGEGVTAGKAAVSGSEKYTAKIAAAKAEAAARKTATEALGKGTAKTLTQAEVEAAAARPWDAPKPNWAGMGDEAATEAAAIAPKPTVASSAASYQDELKATNEARAARLAALDKEEAVRKATAPVKTEPMSAAEERLYNAAEAKDARDQIKVANDYLKATEAARTQAATKRAVGDGVKRSSVPKTDDVIDGDFIDPKHVSVVPDTPPSFPGDKLPATQVTYAKAPAVPPNYEATAGQTAKVEEFRRRFGAERAAKKFGMTKDQVNQIRLDAGDRGGEALGEAAGIPESFVDRIKGTLREMKARGASRDEVLAYIRKANNEKARWQVEGFARGMDLL